MSRLMDAVLDKGVAYSGHSPVSNLAVGGQNGYFANIGKVGADGKNYGEWISNQAYVKRNLIPIVITYPKFFDFMPEKDKWIEAYKALIELHPLEITGLVSGLTVETDSHAVGMAGQVQEEVTDVKRAVSTITFTYKEKQGKAIQKFLDAVIRNGYMDPDTKKPLVANLIEDISKVGGLYSADFYTGTTLFIEPDITMKTVVDAYMVANMFFKSNGDRTSSRSTTTGGSTLDLSIECAGITMSNEAVMEYADAILSKLTVINKLPDTDMVLPDSEMDATVATKVNGYNQDATN